jgi:hypothetical protein
MMSVATAARLRVALSSAWWTRFTRVARSRTHGVRARVRSAQLPLRPRWDEAGTHQAMGQALGDPVRVLDVGRAARDRLEVRSIEQPDLAGARQPIADGLPNLPRAPQAHGGAVTLGQPIGEAQKLASGGPNGLCLGHACALRIARQPADDHRPRVHVHTCATLNDDVHDLPPRSSTGGVLHRLVTAT